MPILVGGNVIEGAEPAEFSGSGSPVDGTDEVQRITIGGTPESGSTFVLSWDGWSTPAIAWSATDATLVAHVQAALDALNGLVGPQTVVAEVSLTSGVGTISITYSGANVAKKNLPQIAGSSFLKSDGTASTGTIATSTTTPGVDATFRDAPTGSRYTDKTAGVDYVNTGTAQAPTWTAVTVGGISAEMIALAAALPVAAVADAGAATAVATTSTAAAVAGTVPAGGTGAAAGAFDTSGHRDTFIATVDEIKATVNDALVDIVDAEAQIDALVDDVDDLRSQVNDLLAKLRTAAIVTP